MPFATCFSANFTTSKPIPSKDTNQLSKELSTEQDDILTVALQQTGRFTEDEKRIQDAINVDEWVPDTELSVRGWLIILLIAAVVLSPIVLVIVTVVNFFNG